MQCKANNPLFMFMNVLELDQLCYVYRNNATEFSQYFLKNFEKMFAIFV